MLQTCVKAFLVATGVVLIEVGLGLQNIESIDNAPAFLIGWGLCGVALMVPTAREKRLERQITRMYQ